MFRDWKRPALAGVHSRTVGKVAAEAAARFGGSAEVPLSPPAEVTRTRSASQRCREPPCLLLLLLLFILSTKMYVHINGSKKTVHLPVASERLARRARCSHELLDKVESRIDFPLAPLVCRTNALELLGFLRIQEDEQATGAPLLQAYVIACWTMTAPCGCPACTPLIVNALIVFVSWMSMPKEERGRESVEVDAHSR